MPFPIKGGRSNPAFADSDQLFYVHDGCLEIYFDALADARTQGEAGYDDNDSRYDCLEDMVYRFKAVNWQLAQGTQSATNKEISEKLERRFTRTEKGYVCEFAFAERYLAPIELKPGSVAGFGLCLHDWSKLGQDGTRRHGTLSTATRRGCDLDRKPYLLPLMVLGE